MFEHLVMPVAREFDPAFVAGLRNSAPEFAFRPKKRYEVVVLSIGMGCVATAFLP